MLLIDADYLTYAIPFTCQVNGELTEPEWVCRARLDDEINKLVNEFDCGIKLYLTGKGNFRNEVATIQPYKGNRTDFVRPHFYGLARQHLIDKWGATVVNNWEADDEICIQMYALDGAGIACHIDKDLNQIPGLHYNPKKQLYYRVTEDEADLFFWMQTLMGDTSDNIPGVRGIGPKKAEKLLATLTPAEREAACLEAHGGDRDRLREIGTLLYLLRHPDDYFKLRTDELPADDYPEPDDTGGDGSPVLPDWEPADGPA